MIQENQYALVLLTLSYLVGEMGHFLLSSTSRDISRDIGYGDKACFNVINMTDSCGSIKNREGCEASKCSWEYTGLGLDYQVYFPIDSLLMKHFNYFFSDCSRACFHSCVHSSRRFIWCICWFHEQIWSTWICSPNLFLINLPDGLCNSILASCGAKNVACGWVSHSLLAA